MDNTTISASFTYPTADVNAFADVLGYQEFVFPDGGFDNPIPNPESRVDFVKRKFVEHTVDWMTARSVQELRNQRNSETEALITQHKETIKGLITVS